MTLPRYLKFNLVGALGMVVQLTTLAMLHHLAPNRYLVATILALELTLLHNFLWHLHVTWPHARSRAKTLQALLRFHLTSGVVSMTGNLLLMSLFVGLLRFPVVAANALAILSCSLANFALSDRWTFASPQQTQRSGRRLRDT